MSMTPITARKDAKAAGEKQYFTGKPCRNGHISHRYTDSGTCAECISEASKQYRRDLLGYKYKERARIDAEREARNAAAKANKDARVAARRKLVWARLAIVERDLDLVFETAEQLCYAWNPVLTPDDVYSPRKMVSAGVPIYAVQVPPDTWADTLRRIAEELYQKHCGIDIEKERARILGTILKQVDDESQEPPEGWK